MTPLVRKGLRRRRAARGPRRQRRRQAARRSCDEATRMGTHRPVRSGPPDPRSLCAAAARGDCRCGTSMRRSPTTGRSTLVVADDQLVAAPADASGFSCRAFPSRDDERIALLAIRWPISSLSTCPIRRSARRRGALGRSHGAHHGPPRPHSTGRSAAGGRHSLINSLAGRHRDPETQSLASDRRASATPGGETPGPIRVPVGRRRHVPEHRRRGDDRRTRQIALSAHTHPVLPVAIERRDRALARLQRIRPLAEAGSAPRLSNLAAGAAERRRRSTTPPSRGSARSIWRATPPEPGKTISGRAARVMSGVDGAIDHAAPPAAGRRSCRWCTNRSAPCRT